MHLHSPFIFYVFISRVGLKKDVEDARSCSFLHIVNIISQYVVIYFIIIWKLITFYLILFFIFVCVIFICIMQNMSFARKKKEKNFWHSSKLCLQSYSGYKIEKLKFLHYFLFKFFMHILYVSVLAIRALQIQKIKLIVSKPVKYIYTPLTIISFCPFLYLIMEFFQELLFYELIEKKNNYEHSNNTTWITLTVQFN